MSIFFKFYLENEAEHGSGEKNKVEASNEFLEELMSVFKNNYIMELIAYIS